MNPTDSRSFESQCAGCGVIDGLAYRTVLAPRRAEGKRGKEGARGSGGVRP